MDKKPPHSFAQRFIRGNILDRWWSLVLSGIGFVSSYFSITALSLHDFGLYQLVLSALAITNTVDVGFFDGVILNDITRAMSDDRKSDAKRLFLEFAVLKIGASILITIALFLGAQKVASWYNPAIASYIRILSIMLVIDAFQTVAGAFLGSIVSLRAMGSAAVREGSKVFMVAGLFFFSKLDIRGLLIATVIASFIAFIYTFIPFLSEFRSHLKGIKPSREFLFGKILKTYGFWVIIRSAVGQSADNIRPWVVRALLNTEAVALYTLAINLVTFIKKASFPVMTSSLLAWEVSNLKRLRYIFTRSVKYCFLYGAVVTVGSFIFVPPLIGIIFPKYLPAMPLFKLLLLTVPLYGISSLEYSLLTALREQKILAARLFVEIAILFLSLVLLIPVMGVLAIGVGPVANITWRTRFFYNKMIKKYPELKFNLRTLFWFDEEDRVIFMRGINETRSFLRI